MKGRSDSNGGSRRPRHNRFELAASAEKGKLRHPRRVKRQLPALILMTALSLVAASCAAPRTYLAVARGNYAYDRGAYQEATVDYLDAQKSDAYPGWVAYDLGNVYHALGEPGGAEAEWSRAEKANDPQVVAATLYNEGVLDYELGRYREAYDHFRKSLELMPGSIDAKINLELAFAKMTTKEMPPSTGRSSEPVAIQHKENQANQILDIVRQKENGYFTPPSPARHAPRVDDW